MKMMRILIGERTVTVWNMKDDMLGWDRKKDVKHHLQGKSKPVRPPLLIECKRKHMQKT